MNKKPRSTIRAYSIASVSPRVLEAVQKVQNECFGSGDYFYNEGKLKHELSLNSVNRLFVAYVNKEIAGFLLCVFRPQFDKLQGDRLGVSRKFRRKGLARALVLRAMEYAHKEDAIYITYIAIENTASVRLHLNCGMQIVKSDKNFIYLRD